VSPVLKASPWLSDTQCEDVAMSAILRLLEARREDRVDVTRNVMGYLLRYVPAGVPARRRGAN
jgi:hypothetical protein